MADRETDSLLNKPRGERSNNNNDDDNTGNSTNWRLILGLALVALVLLIYSKIQERDKDTSFATVEAKLKLLAVQLEGRVVFPDDEENFAEASRVWREDVVARNPPLVIVEAASENDVQLSIPVLASLSQQYSIPFRIRSGGHNKAGFSTTHGIVLSLKHMRNAELIPTDASDNFGIETNNNNNNNNTKSDGTTKMVVALIQPGATVEVVLDELLAKEGAGGTVGMCGNVAEGGFVLGGGIGFMSRSLGLGIDNVRSFRMVLWDGTVISANKDSHSELFFALRGAGSGNFGVVTEMKYELYHPMPKKQQARMVNIPMKDYAAFLYGLGKYPPSREFLTMFDISSPDSVLAMMSWFSTDPDLIAQSEDRFQAEIAPLLPSSSDYEDAPWSLFDWAEGTHEFSDGPGYSRHLYAEQVWQGFMMPANNTMEVWSHIVMLFQEIVRECPDVHPDIELWGGAISDASDHNETAFAYRDALFNVGVQLYVLDEDEYEAFVEQMEKVNQWWPSVAQYLNGAYVNYPMNSLTKEEYPRLYWGDHLERLVKVKQEYDPQNLFQYEQSVPIALET